MHAGEGTPGPLVQVDHEGLAASEGVKGVATPIGRAGDGACGHAGYGGRHVLTGLPAWASRARWLRSG
jgi:hypothetical protein